MNMFHPLVLPVCVRVKSNRGASNCVSPMRVKLDANCVDRYCKPDTKIAVYVDGEPFTGDPRTIELTDQKVIVIAIGTPPPVIPSTADFSNA